MKNFLKNLIEPQEDNDNTDYRKYTYKELRLNCISYWPLYISLFFSLFEIYFIFTATELPFRLIFLFMLIYDSVKMVNTSISNEIIEQQKFIIQKCIAHSTAIEGFIVSDEGYIALCDEERPIKDGDSCWIIKSSKTKRAYIALPVYIEFDEILKSRIVS